VRRCHDIRHSADGNSAQPWASNVNQVNTVAAKRLNLSFGGSRRYIRTARYTAKSFGSGKSAAVQPTDMTSVRILIVDDNQTIRRGIRSLLSSRQEWTVCGEAPDGIEAIERVRELRPTLVLMDISMPRMNGIDATRVIRRENPQCEVILVSQNDPIIGARQAEEIGARGYVAKSEISRTLLPTIDRVIAPGDPEGPRPGARKSKAAESNGNINNSSSLGDASEGQPSGQTKLTVDHSTNLLLTNAPAPKLASRATSLLAAIVESADDAIISKDLDGVIKSWNSSAERMFGYTVEEAIGKHITIIIPPERRAEETKIIDQLKRGQRIDHFETVRMSKDGTTREVSLTISPVLDQDGVVVGASKVARDISERKQQGRGNRLLAAVVESSDDAIISKNLDGVITSWNGSAQRMFGFTEEEAVGKPITIIIPPERRGEEKKILEQLRKGQRVEHFETVRMRKDGTTFDISLAISPVLDEQGRVVGASKVARDITEQKRIDRALRESEEQLRSLAEGLETQVRVRTQELEERNAEVVAQSSLLRELSNRLLRSQDDERRRVARELHDSAGQVLTALGISLANMREHAQPNTELAKELRDAQEMLQALNKEIRTMSYLLHPPLLDENGLVEALRWYIAGLSERSGLEIDLQASEKVGRLPGEIELALFRIVQECLTNIHRHSGSKTASIRLSLENSEITLQIQDAGRGMSATRLANVKEQRSGVGLTGIRERVRHLQGVMTISSDERGTKVVVTLHVPKSSGRAEEEMDEPTRALG